MYHTTVIIIFSGVSVSYYSKGVSEDDRDIWHP